MLVVNQSVCQRIFMMSPVASVNSVHYTNKPFRRPAFQVSRHFPTDPVDATTILDLIHFNCQHNPDHIFASQEVSHQEDLIHITFRDLRDATVACARLLAKSLNPTRPDNRDEDARRPVALLLESDVVLFIHLAALLYLEIPGCPHVPLTLKT